MNMVAKTTLENPLHVEKCNSITPEQKHYIETIIDGNLEHYMQAFGLNSGFDLFRARIYLCDEVEKVLVFLRNKINKVFGNDYVTGNYEYLTSLPVIKLGWIRFTDDSILEDKLLQRVLEERKIGFNYANAVIENIISLNFKLPTLEGDMNLGRSKYVFSMNYELTEVGTSILDGFLIFEGNSINVIERRMRSIRQSIEEVNAKR